MQVTGGSDAVRYLLSFGTTDQNGNYRNDPTRYRQYNIRAKVDVELNKYCKYWRQYLYHA